MGRERAELAKEKRKLATSIRKYGAWLQERDRADLLAYAASIDAEADRLDAAGEKIDVPPPSQREPE